MRPAAATPMAAHPVTTSATNVGKRSRHDRAVSTHRDEQFADFAASRMSMLRRTAYLLCGDTHLADDLVQTTLTKVYVRWNKLARRGELDPYARTVLIRSFYDIKRKSGSRDLVTDDPHAHQRTTPVSAAAHSDDRLIVMNALAQLPPPQRAVVVLRFWNDLDVPTVAALLKIPEGTVKTRTARGLAVLRQYFTTHGWNSSGALAPWTQEQENIA